MIVKNGKFNDIVLWNIGEEGAKAMSDLGEGEWQNYICVEVGQIKDAVVLKQYENWRAGQSLIIFNKNKNKKMPQNQNLYTAQKTQS